MFNFFLLFRTRIVTICFIFCLFTLGACSDKSGEPESKLTTVESPKKNEIDSNQEKEKEETKNLKKINYGQLQKKIIYGVAQLHEVYEALTDHDVGSLTNTVHGLYSMRWHRGVYNLLDDLWLLKKEKHPDFAWDLFAKAPVRIALASTINRVKIVKTDEQLEYIRKHKYDEHEFHRAQVVVALGYNGEESDIPYIKSMAMGDNAYVAQSAISGLALMGGEKAKYALAEVWKKYIDTPRGDLAKKLIQKVYNETPSLEKPEQEQDKTNKQVSSTTEPMN